MVSQARSKGTPPIVDYVAKFFEARMMATNAPICLEMHMKASENLPPPRDRREHTGAHRGTQPGEPPRGPLDLRIRPRGFPAMRDPMTASRAIRILI